MPRHERIDVLLAMKAIGMVPVFYHPDVETAKQIVRSCVNAGANVIEFTNRGDFAHEVFRELVAFCEAECPKAILGVGSIVDPYTAALYIQNAADFIVGPTLNAEVAKICNRRKIPYSPGCGSATEVSEAYALGTEIVKIFPGAQVGGPGFVKSIKGPMPWVSIMPTGGVSPTEESIREWFAAGVTCVGMGSKLISKDIVENKDFNTLEKNIRGTLTLIREVRGKK